MSTVEDFRTEWGTPIEVHADGPVHAVDLGGPADGQILVGVHGLGGSHLNWTALAPHLVGHHRLVALDLIGHGRTPLAGRSADVEGHVRAVTATVGAVAPDRPVVLMGNSMGGLVAALHAARHPGSVDGIILIDPALPSPRPGRVGPRALVNMAVCSVPGLGERFLDTRRRRASAETHVRRVLSAVCVDPERVPADVVAAHVALMETGDREVGDAAYLSSARSLTRTLVRPAAAMAEVDTLSVPVLVLHGERDSLLPVAAMRRMVADRVNWTLEVARDIGHAPMLEAPLWTGLRILEWLDTLGGLSPVS